jgi:hypothetical protein
MRYSQDMLNMGREIDSKIALVRSYRRITELDMLVATQFAIGLSANLDAPVSFPVNGHEVIVDTLTSSMVIRPLTQR